MSEEITQNLEKNERKTMQNEINEIETNYQKIKEDILLEEKQRSQKDKLNKELLKQIKAVELAEGVALREKAKLIKLTQKRNTL